MLNKGDNGLPRIQQAEVNAVGQGVSVASTHHKLIESHTCVNCNQTPRVVFERPFLDATRGTLIDQLGKTLDPHAVSVTV